MKRVFIIDIDGTLCEDIPNERPLDMVDAKEVAGAKDWLNELYEAGNFICLFTARTDDLVDVTLNWLSEHGFKYHQIIFGKPRRVGYEGYFYVDNARVQAATFKGEYRPFRKQSQEIEVL